MQRTPSPRARCSTLTPTAPDAPCTTTVSPARTPVTCSISAAVVPARSRFAAAGGSRGGGARGRLREHGDRRNGDALGVPAGQPEGQHLVADRTAAGGDLRVRAERL